MKSAISLPDDLFDRINAAAADAGMSRSAFLAAAAEAFLRQQDEDDVTARIDASIAKNGQPTEPGVLEAGMTWLKDEAW